MRESDCGMCGAKENFRSRKVCSTDVSFGDIRHLCCNLRNAFLNVEVGPGGPAIRLISGSKRLRQGRYLRKKHHSPPAPGDSLHQTSTTSTMEDPVTIVSAKSQPSATSVSPESATASFSQAAHDPHENPEVIHPLSLKVRTNSQITLWSRISLLQHKEEMSGFFESSSSLGMQRPRIVTTRCEHRTPRQEAP